MFTPWEANYQALLGRPPTSGKAERRERLRALTLTCGWRSSSPVEASFTRSTFGRYRVGERLRSYEIRPAGMTSQVVMTSTTLKQMETSDMMQTNSQTFAQRALHARSLELLIVMISVRRSLDAQ